MTQQSWRHKKGVSENPIPKEVLKRKNGTRKTVTKIMNKLDLIDYLSDTTLHTNNNR